MEYKKIEDGLALYWEGNSNLLIRTWTYIKVGLQQANDYKYVAAAIFGIYYTLKLANPIWIGVMFIVSLPLLAVLGRWWLYRGQKTSEFVTTTKGSVLGYNSYNIQIQQNELLEEILNALKNARTNI